MKSKKTRKERDKEKEQDREDREQGEVREQEQSYRTTVTTAAQQIHIYMGTRAQCTARRCMHNCGTVKL